MTHCWHIVRFAKSLRISQRISAFARCAKANIACSRPHMSLRIMCCHPPFRKREHDAAAGCSFACTLRWHWRCLRCCRLPSEACSESDLLIGCLAAAILQAVRLCLFPSEQALPWLFSMIAADVMAVLLYAGHLWGAGDSKLFAFSYLCFPISLLSDSTLTNSFLPYIFIFLPAFSGQWWIASTKQFCGKRSSTCRTIGALS